MKIQPVNLCRRFSNSGFILLFPGFLVYHTLLSWGVMPPFLAGLFGPVVAALFFLYLLFFFTSSRIVVEGAGLYSVLFIVFIFYALFWTFLHYAFLDEGYSKSASQQSIETIVMWFSLFFVGVFFSHRSKPVLTAFHFVFVLAVVLLLYFVFTTGHFMYYARQLSVTESGVATYQGFARSMLVISVFLLAVSSSMKMRAWLVVGSLFGLFLFGARSELYAYIIFLVALLSIWSLTSIKYQMLVIFLTSIMSVILVASYDAISSSRQFQVFDLSNASSWVARQELMSLAIHQIRESLLLGDFGAHVRDGSGTGSYVHNILSSWVNYGFFGFILYFSLTITAFLAAFYRIFVKRSRCPIWIMAFGFNLISLVLILVAKSVFWPIPALGWGVYAQALILSNPRSDKSYFFKGDS
jgi:hypothetical protein